MGTEAAPAVGDTHRAAKLERPAPAREGGQSAVSPALNMRSASLLRLQRSVGNHVVAAILASPHIQRCGPAACNCSAEERQAKAADTLAQRATETVAQRVLPADLRVEGKWGGAASEPRSIFFDYANSAFDG